MSEIESSVLRGRKEIGLFQDSDIDIVGEEKEEEQKE
jgi:hypothetical protein